MRNDSTESPRGLSVVSILLAPLLGASLLAGGALGQRSEGASSASAASSLTFAVVDTGQAACYDASAVISCPAAGQPFHGQDAQHAGRAPAFTVSADGLTVLDDITGLTWQRSPDTDGDGNLTLADKRTFAQAQSRPAALNAARYGGFDDWRLPTIKELYSLIDFRGTDPSGYSGTDTSGLRPFLDTTVFRFAYGSAPERIIDSQYASSTTYVAGSTSLGSGGKLFGVNFADGRIKGYDLVMPDGTAKTFFVQCVRGGAGYGVNAFVEHGDGTVTDSASGLMWTADDSGSAMTWQEALAWAAARNAETLLGYDDWRLPDAKELQGLLDYSRSPDTTASAAIDSVFTVTAITNEGGVPDFPWYWASTTHTTYNGRGAAGVYLGFGRSGGWMKATPSASCYTWTDVHGAGAQRSDPKTPAGKVIIGTACNGGAAYGVGPQGDVLRGANFVRLVRDAGTTGGSSTVTRFLPIVLDVTGRARYTSELTLGNRGTTGASVTLAYTAAAGLGASGSGTVTLPLAAGRQLVLDDAVEALRSHGLAIPAGNQGGSLRATFSGLSSAGAAWAGVRITAPAENGRAGVAYAGPLLEELPVSTSWLHGLRSSSRDRTNVAFANASTSSPVTLRLTLVSGDGSAQSVSLPDVTLGPGQWAQLDDVLVGTGLRQAWASVSPVSGPGPYFAYAVFNDDETNDGSFVPFETDPVPAEARLVPVVVESGPFSTELVLTNRTSRAQTVELSYAESISPAAGAGGVATETLAAGEQKLIPSIVEVLRSKAAGVIGPPGGSYAGSLSVRFLSGDDPAAGYAGARTGSPSRSGTGRYGLFYEGVGTSGQARTAAWVYGLRQDALVRANVAVAASPANGAPVNVHVEVYDGGTGALAGTTAPVALSPGAWFQWTNLLPSHGVSQGYVRVVNESLSGTFTAYGVVNDGASPGSATGTDDGSFVPGVPDDTTPAR